MQFLDEQMLFNVSTTTLSSSGCVLGVDVSEYNKYATNTIGLNWKKAYDGGVRFAFLRSMGFNSSTNLPRKDRDIDLNWKQVKENGILRGTYLFWVWIREPQVHIDMLNKIYVNGYDGELPMVVDLEPFANWGNYPPRLTLLIKLEKMLAEVDKWSKRSTIFYSNPSTISYLSPIPTWLKDRNLWIANYNVSKPDLRGQWSRWDFFQFTDRMDASLYGMDSKQVDGNWWNGNLDELRKFCNLRTITPPPHVYTIEDRVHLLETWAGSMGYNIPK